MDKANHPIMSISETLPERAGELLLELRDSQPRIHAITNNAAQIFTANLLLAAGAIPSLTIAAGEVADFTSRSAALLINLGTLDRERNEAVPIAVDAARENGKPWVLDPVFVEASPIRLETAHALLASRPTVLRCNAAEFQALSRTESPVTTHEILAFAKEQRLTIALTGPVDVISDGERIISIHNGHPFMSRTTAMGCAGTALIAAFLALTDDALEAAGAALLIIGITGEISGAEVSGPGSFPASFLDTLYGLTPSIIRDFSKVS